MKKIYLFGLLLFSTIFYGQNFNSFASGIRIGSTIYNTTGSGINAINPTPTAQSFNMANLGTFGQNSTCARITASEIKTFKTATSNVCSATMFWRVYLASASPTGTFNTIPLVNLVDCNIPMGTYNDGLGPCSANDQKWKDYTISTNFINGLTTNNYVLEVYFQLTGSDTNSATCEITRLTNNNGVNFKANFTISNPTINPTVSPALLCEGQTLTLTANASNGVPPYSYSWTGPNGYTSSAANPIISTTNQSGGVYSLIVTDACGATTASQNTASVNVTPKVDPVFEGINPGLCRFGTPPLLPNQSTNGINGTWNPSMVDNSTVGTFNYTFTPNSGECATTFVQTIFVVNNVTPSFSFPTSICQGSTPPSLPTNSNNGVLGSWNPTNVSNTASGSYLFTPSAGQCATTRTINVTVTPPITPIFSIPNFVCENTNAPSLPNTSNNGITGTWNPTLASNTASGTYVFTPNNPSQCGQPFSIFISVNPNTTPTFTLPNFICQNSVAPSLPNTSNNGITGTWNPTLVSNTASGNYVFTPDNPSQCSSNFTLNIIVNPNVTPTFTLPAQICQDATAPNLPNTSNNGITGTWNPTLASNTASGSYVFTPNNASQCGTPFTYNLTVNPNVTPTFTLPAQICQNSTAPSLPNTSNNGITGTWNPTLVSNTASGSYVFTPNNPSQCGTPFTYNLTVNPNVTPTFTLPAQICQNNAAPSLQNTSNNGITGTWNPTLVSNTASGNYVFTPNDASQCGTPFTYNLTVNPNVTPTFTLPAQICQNSTEPSLPNTSNNGITGTWNPALASNTASGSYIFTPNDASQCGTPFTYNLTVNPNVTPTFTLPAQICQDATAPILPNTSNNGITGTWNPTLASNTASGSYVFTPNDASQCGTPFTYNLTVNPNVTPTFTLPAQICQDATAPSLPNTSNNGITGTWNPTLASNTASGSYIFTPNDASQCGTPFTYNLTVNPNVTPTFTLPAQICQNSTAPSLPNTSNNGITGTWNPALASNTASGSYVFTPNNPSQCGTPFTYNLTVNPNVIPTFTLPNQICQDATAPILQNTSNNGITGTWNPTLASNTASGSYVFTPNNASQCVTPFTYNLTVNPNVTPTFTLPAQICQNSTAPSLPNTSNNGITGTWNPTLTSNTASGSYIFTPNDTLQCGTIFTYNLNVSPSFTPTFILPSQICQNSTAPNLPNTSNNGITGTWNPTLASNTASGSYVFTPNNPSQCGTILTYNLTINPTIIPVFTLPAQICQNATAPILPNTSNNGISGTWNPALVSNTESGSYVFTPTSNLNCEVGFTYNLTVNPNVTPFFTLPNQICQNATAPILQNTSNNGITGTWNPMTVSNTTSGSYLFTPNNASQCGSSFTYNTTITPKITPTFSSIAPICSGSTRPTLQTTSSNGITGTWNPAIVSNQVSANYIFTPSTTECANAVSVAVVVYNSPSNINFTQTTIVNGNPTGILEITSVDGGLAPYAFSFEGSPFTSNTSFPNLSSGDFTVTVKDSRGCTFTQTFTLESDCLFPKGISPNEDGLNDSFNLNTCNILSLEIFNRYGIKVNSFGNYVKEWKGTDNKGNNLPDGTYFYVARLQDNSTKTGWVYVLRN
jgi:gliding motility-associated-like protein